MTGRIRLSKRSVQTKSFEMKHGEQKKKWVVIDAEGVILGRLAAVVATRLNALKCVEEGPLAAMREFEATQQRLSTSEDAKEGVRSFVERRAAQFTGR